MTRSLAAAAVAAAVACALAAVPEPASADPAPNGQVEVEIPGPEQSGHRHTAAGSGHTLVSPHGKKPAKSTALSPGEAAGDGDVTKVVDNGPTGDRLDIVFVGDGYTGAELDRFHTDVKERWNEVAAVEPYATYANLFNVWAVDAVSRDSGVSGDPGKDVVRDTALGSYFWCDDIERLLCIDEAKVDSYVDNAPEADLVMVLSNSSKYGGAGYNTPSPTLGYDGIATASAGNALSGQVAIHETGHSLGKLADEYFYPGTPGYEHYSGPEPGDSNISTLSAAQMENARTKWYRWLGETSPDGGTVGAYEGGGYYVTGLNRPTDASMMRVLGKPFNLPGTEAMIAGFHRHASAARALTPTSRPLRSGDTARISLARPLGDDARPLQVRWSLDGKRIGAPADATEVAVADLGVRGSGAHRLTVTVVDRTDAVRDPAIAKSLRTTLTWTVRR
ncbi:M64 family metallopeptidase [Streptomyces sp. NBC_01304]|uniref:M64 family metallopeptidase n=1 Tax=Streptomyces sp. NBC_01304 TaxID=2903818 RepID=UPI002E13566E|nr:M64 family metallopeptidase [Streptomyces sp. NBC_01304]